MDVSTSTSSGHPRRIRCPSDGLPRWLAKPKPSPVRGSDSRPWRSSGSISRTSDSTRLGIATAQLASPPTLRLVTTDWSCGTAATGRPWQRAASLRARLRYQPVLPQEETTSPEQEIESGGHDRPRQQRQQQRGRRIPSQQQHDGHAEGAQTERAQGSSAGIGPGLCRSLFFFDQRQGRRQDCGEGQEQPSEPWAAERPGNSREQGNHRAKAETKAEVGRLDRGQPRPVEANRLTVILEKPASLHRLSIQRYVEDT